MDQQDDHYFKSHQRTRYVNENKYGNRKSYGNWGDKTDGPRLQSARYRTRQNFENSELQCSKAASLGSSCRMRADEHEWENLMFHEAKKNVGYEDQPRTKRRSKQRKRNQTSSRETQLTQADRPSSRQGHVPSDEWKHGDRGHFPSDDWKHGDQGHIPLDDWILGDQGHIPLDDRKHGDRGHIPLDDRKHGDRGHIPLNDRKHGDQGHIPLDDWKLGDQGHIPLDDGKHGDQGHIQSDDWKLGDQAAASADDHTWEDCAPGVMEFLRSVRPYNDDREMFHENQTICANEKSAIEKSANEKSANEKSEDGHDKPNSTAKKVKTGKIKPRKVKQGDKVKDSRSESDCNRGKNEASGAAGKAMGNEKQARLAASDDDGRGTRAGMDTVRYTAGQESCSEIKLPTVKKKAGKSQAKLDDKTGIIFKNTQLASPVVVGPVATNHGGLCEDGEVTDYQTKKKGRENNNLKIVKLEESSDVKACQSLARFAGDDYDGDGGSARAGKDRFRHAPEQGRAETKHRVDQQQDSYNEIKFPTGKSQTKLDGKTSLVFKNSQFKHRTSNHEGSYKDGESSATENNIRGKENISLKIVEGEESCDNQKDSRRMQITSSDQFGKEGQSSAREAKRRTNFRPFTDIIKKVVEENAKSEARNKEKRTQQPKINVSGNQNDNRVQTNTETNCRTVRVDCDGSTAQDSPRGSQNLKLSKRVEEEPLWEIESRNLNPHFTASFTETCRVRNPDKANMTEYFARNTGIELREAEVDVRRDKTTEQSMSHLCFPTDKKATRPKSHKNSLPPEHSLQGTFHSSDNVSIEHVWNKIKTDAKIQIEKHQAKYVEVREQISDLEDEKKAKKKWVTIDEHERRLEIRVPLKMKICELEKQEQEFCKHLDQLKKEIDRLKVESRLKNRVNVLRSRFSRELKRFATALPLYARKSDIIDTILANGVSIILGETGSGKSTQMLQYLYEAGLSSEGVIVSTQPRKVAALSLARRVAQEMGCKVGTLVGYHVGSKDCYGLDTQLMYVTDNALLNDCLQDAMFTKYSCVIIDEAHERSIYTDLLLGFVKKALVARKDLKVVITSATIDPDVFVRYFSTRNFVPPVLTISGRAFPVDVFYEEPAEDYVTAACDKALEVHWSEPPGDILVFLSSPIETERACKRFQIQVGNGEAVILELHGRMQVEDQQKVFEILPPQKRKVVFATNSAETSITIPGIKYVIDTGRVREVSYDPLKNMSTLKLTWVNKSSAEQRKGRAGRTDCGKCFRLYTEEQYKHDMRPVSVPEILRVHLGQALLKISSLGVNNPTEFEFVESPSFAAIESAMSVLRELNAYGNRGITDLGRKLAKIALEPRLGKAALLGLEQKIAYETLVMAVIASFGGNVFFRVGTDEQKQEADKRKTRFCDQWGDIVTLVNVYKEWERVPSKQGAWCVENSINGKSMKMAREALREILKTFKQDLRVTVRKRWSSDPDLNYRLAKIIFHCYSTNLCRFSGHPRGGYYLARLPSVSLQLHPSSAFNYMKDFPRWVVYEQVFTTSRTFMQNTTYVDESWIQEEIARGRLPDSVFDTVERYLLEPSVICTVGATCMNRMLSGKAQELKRMENCLKDLLNEDREKVVIDVLPSDGTVTVYTTKWLTEHAVREIDARVSVIRKSLQDECIKQPIRTGASVQLILEKGAKIRTILMPYESRQVKISKVSNEFAGDVEQLLSVYGEIETVKLLDGRRKDRGRDKKETWGFVTYKFPEPAKKVVEDAALLPFQVELQKQVLQLVNRIEDFKVKVKVCRRRQRDFGFVRFKDAFHATLALASINSIKVESRSAPCPQNLLNDYIFHVPNCNQNIQLISVTPDKRNSQQMYLKRIPQWADKKMIWDALSKALNPELAIEEVAIARERPPAAVLSAALFAEFCQAIRSKLWINGNLWDFHLQAVPPAEKAYYMTAYVAFSSAYQAQVARDLLNDSLIVGSQAVAVVELRTSVFVSGPIFRLFGARILAEMEDAVNSSGGGLSIQTAERRNGGHSIQLEAASLDLLREGKARIDAIVNGLEVTLDLKRFSHLKSSDGKRFLELLQRETQAILRLDERRQAVFVHGGRKSAEDVKNRLCKYLFTDFPERVIDIQLRGSEFPSGLMKVLVLKYGSNLEGLKNLSGTTTVELLLRKHVIQVQGSDESVLRLKELIEKEARRIPGRNAAVKSSMPNCPVCLGPVDLESSYIMEYCGHSYCKECALSLIDNGLENNEIPIQCAAEGCSQDVTIRDLRNLPVDINKVFDTAIRAFVQTNSTDFGYCITADCPMVYRKARENKNGEMFQCSECQLKLCTACASEFHHGMSCEVYRCLQGEDNDIKTWLTERPKDRSLCPQCKMGIEKNGGCMHVECTACRVHICWRCKSTFSASARCYDHLTKCGGIFGNENFVL